MERYRRAAERPYKKVITLPQRLVSDFKNSFLLKIFFKFYLLHSNKYFTYILACYTHTETFTYIQTAKDTQQCQCPAHGGLFTSCGSPLHSGGKCPVTWTLTVNNNNTICQKDCNIKSASCSRTFVCLVYTT